MTERVAVRRIPGVGGQGDSDCPPEDLYELRFIRIIEFKKGTKQFRNPQTGELEEPREQFTLEFEMVDHIDKRTGGPKLLRAWYTPILHKTDPLGKLYKLIKAINNGSPYEPRTDDEGYTLEVDFWEEVEAFAGGTFRQTVAPVENTQGQVWARMIGDPMPMRIKKSPPPPAKKGGKKKTEVVDEETGELLESNSNSDVENDF